ncbi:MAG: SPFH domain-containing protein [Candidatus ainarchaeum sp.]|nr:SPFH domain-containing protein [Candidatus ainarchaeum sp.]
MAFDYLGCIIPVGIFGLIFLASFIKIVMEYQKGILFTLGKYSKMLNPGLNFVIPIIQSAVIVDTRITTIDIPKQEVMTRDNVPVSVNAVIYMKVIDPEKAVLKIQNYIYAVSQYGQTALRDVIGNKELDFVLTERDKIADEIKLLVDRETDDWGIDITALKVQDIELPADMKRIMARQAEAEREKRANIIKSTGEVIAADNLAKAAKTLTSSPGSMHLRTLEVLSDISSDASNKIIFAVPIELMKAIEGFAETFEKPKKKL